MEPMDDGFCKKPEGGGGGSKVCWFVVVFFQVTWGRKIMVLSEHVYVIPGTSLSSILGFQPPPKEDPFHSKQGSFGFQVLI